MAYHQGTTWVFPRGGFYLAYLKVYGAEGAAWVREGLDNLEAMMREGCAGQLHEIYDGENPSVAMAGKASAWRIV